MILINCLTHLKFYLVGTENSGLRWLLFTRVDFGGLHSLAISCQPTSQPKVRHNLSKKLSSEAKREHRNAVNFVFIFFVKDFVFIFHHFIYIVMVI